MDFPKSVPSVGLVDGKFIDEDAVAGTPGSLIPSAWGNAVTQEILNVIQEAGLEPDEDDNTQLNAAIDQKIAGSSVAFASQPEAEEGTLTTKAMSPLRVFQAIAKVVTQATEAAFGWLKIATQTQVTAGVNDSTAVTPKKLATSLQAQASTAFPTAGAAGTLTLTPVPAIDAYAPTLRFRVKFNRASTGSDTINISGKGPKSLKQYDASGAKVAAVFAIDQLGDIEYDGTDAVLLDQLPTSAGAVQGAFKNLVVSTTGLSAVVTVTADELSVGNSSGGYQTLRPVSVTPSFAAAGVNGIDVGSANSQTVSTWYSVWVISNGASVAGLLSLSATAPTLPAGYTHRARVGWVFTDASANKYPLTSSQSGRVGGIKVVAGTNSASPRAIASGTTSSAYVATSISPYVPPTASAVLLRLYSTNANNVVGAVAPNTSYGALTAGTPPSFTSSFAPVALSSPGNASPCLMLQGRLMLESSNIYYLSNSSTMTLLAEGWEDNL